MEKKFRVSGQYLAKYANGSYSGNIGISADIQAVNQRQAIDAVANQVISRYGYVRLDWVNVTVQSKELVA